MSAMNMDSVLPEAVVQRARSASRFLDDSLNRFPEWLDAPDFSVPRGAGDIAALIQASCSALSVDSELMQALRQQRQREMARIALRELAGLADFDETLRDLSDLADACCAVAVDKASASLFERYGVPRDAQGRAVRPVVLGMGKLGGRELNFSSDIDLIVAYTARGRTDGQRPIENEQFFARLVQAMTRLLSARTEHGFVFRVDLMLRPFGASGPPAVSFTAAEQYYQEHGREWERYALIKARPVAGDLAAGHELLKRLQPFVYRRYLDFTAIGSLRELKRRIRDDVANRGQEDSIKLGEGGIRELEFIVQSFQLVRGGQDARLQGTRFRPTLKRLAEIGLMDGPTVSRLDQCYRFLRRLENAVQMYADQQTHALPTQDAPRAALLVAMGVDDWGSLVKQYGEVRAFVHAEFDRVFAAPSADAEDATWDRAMDSAMSSDMDSSALARELVHLGLDASAAGAIVPLLQALASSRRVRVLPDAATQRLRAVVARLMQQCSEHADPVLVAQRSLKVVEAIVGRSTYLSLLLESDTARSQLVRLCAASSWVTDFLAQSPATLDMLLDARQLYAPPTLEQMREDVRARIETVGDVGDGGSAAMDALRRYRQETMLRIAAADVIGLLPLVKVSDHLSWLAEAVLQQALECAEQEMRAQYGMPPGSGDAARIAAIAYGKFGGFELGYGSDLDLVFVYDAESLQADTLGGARSLSTAAWFVRLVQRLIHWLSTLTPAGRCYEVDLELRPSGRSGLVVSTLKSYAEYQRDKAWTWEHQALTRARFVAGDSDLGGRFESLRKDVIATPRDADKLRHDVLDMRDRMRSQRGRTQAGRWDMKLGTGGLVDIEFITQYLLLREAPQQPDLTRWSDNWRQLDALCQTGVIGAADKDRLIEIYRSYRRETHAAALQQRGTTVDESLWHESRQEVVRLWNRVFGLEGESALRAG